LRERVARAGLGPNFNLGFLAKRFLQHNCINGEFPTTNIQDEKGKPPAITLSTFYDVASKSILTTPN